MTAGRALNVDADPPGRLGWPAVELETNAMTVMRALPAGFEAGE